MSAQQNDYNDYWDDENIDNDYWPPDEDDYEDEWPPCNTNCGPICEHWGGDGSCMLAIEEQAAESEDYHSKYTLDGVLCPVCNQSLILHQVKADELYIWPTDEYGPMVGLEVYAAYDTPKEILHTKGKIYHIKIHSAKPHEKLIQLLGKSSRLSYR